MDIETVIHRVLQELLTTHRVRLPVLIACIGRNGSVLFTRLTRPPPGSPAGTVEQEHVTGEIDDEGFLAPIHMLATDATGRAHVAVQRGTGEPVVSAVE